MWHIQYNYYETSLLPLKNLLAGIWPVPVFFMIGGFFLTNDKLIDTKKFIFKKIKTLYIPTIILYIIATLLHNIFVRIHFYSLTLDYDGAYITMYSTTDYIKYLIFDLFLAGRELLLAAMWFVCVLFVALCMISIETNFIRRITTSERTFQIGQMLLFLIPAIVYSFISYKYNISIPRYQQIFSAIWLIYVGMIMNQYIKMKYNNKYIFILCLIIVYIFCVFNYDFKKNIVSYTLCTISACYALCYISIFINNHCYYLKRILTFIGRDSFYIMALHLLGFKVMTLIINLFGYQQNLALLSAPTSDNILFYILYVIAGTFIPLLMIYLFRIIKYKMSSESW